MKDSIKNVIIYTDGSCKKNPGPGGWGAILEYNGIEKELPGGEPNTTNNRMEITGVIEALSKLKEPCNVELFTDSRYVCDSINKGWAENWKANGWRKKDRTPALNADLWEKVLYLCSVHNVKFNWVRGHAGNSKNERCDRLAVAQAETFK